MLKVSAPVEQQVATAEMMEYDSAAATPPAAAAVAAAGATMLEYSAQVPVNTAATFLQRSREEAAATLTAAEPEEMEEFNVFRDYFGLIDLVKTFANVPDDLASDLYYFEPELLRERRDSLGSAGSEFSSSNSVESVEVADIYYSAYGMKQAFLDPVVRDESLKMVASTSLPPPSMLLEHKIITTIAKKPQVSVHI